jgi:transposase
VRLWTFATVPATLRAMVTAPPITAAELAALEAAGLGELGARLLAQIDKAHQEIDWRDAKIERLIFEIAQLKRIKFGKKSEQLDVEQRAVFDEAVDADIAAIEAQLAALIAAKKSAGEPVNLPRVDRHHEPESITCACGCALKRIGEDVSEKLDYTPGVFTVERHVRGKWACSQCHTLMQAPVPAEIIDKGIPTAGLLAQVLVAKYADHLPLYRQEQIFGRAGLTLVWRVNLGERRATIWMRTVSRLGDDARHLIDAGRTTRAVDCR